MIGKKLIKNWNLMRVLLLAAGIYVIAHGARWSDAETIIIGIVFTVMALLNVGLCYGSACNAPFPSENIDKKEDITYEEVH